MPGKSYKWSTNLRDDSDAESDSETSPPPRKRIPTPKPQSLEEVVLAEAEQLGEQEKDERFTERREVIDIAEIEEGDVKFVENPFSIATRLANQRKRQKLLHDDLVDQEVVMSEKGGQKNKVCRLHRSSRIRVDTVLHRSHLANPSPLQHSLLLLLFPTLRCPSHEISYEEDSRNKLLCSLLQPFSLLDELLLLLLLPLPYLILLLSLLLWRKRGNGREKSSSLRLSFSKIMRRIAPSSRRATI